MNIAQKSGFLLAGWLLTGALAVGVPVEAHAADKPAGAKPSKLPPAPDPKVQAKVNQYVEMMNHESKMVFESRKNWFSALTAKEGPTCKEHRYSLPSTTGTYARRLTDYKTKIETKPKLETDAAALKLVEALQELDVLYAEGRDVVRGKALENCPKAKELHPKLVASWAKYEEGYDALHAFVEKHNDDLDQREIVTTEKKYGKKYRYHFARIVADSKALLRTIADEAKKDDPAAAPIREKQAAFVTLVEDTKELIKNAKPNPNNPYPSGLSVLMSDSIRGFLRAVDDYAKTAEDKSKKFRERELQSGFEQVISRYNSLVNQMNGVAFDKNMK